ncbi:MAG: hypothetical protein GW809_01065 [Bacteroidetes bacterium]|nr:hypothetical protein [Bacteroidota bacterium]NCQ10752.1 hypothetical protein [Bacteroidota bacterium]
MKFDEWFANQVRKSFDFYEETPDSETMQQFSVLLKKRQSIFSQPFYWAVAASIVLSLGIGFYFTKMTPFSASQDHEVAQNLYENIPTNEKQPSQLTDSLEVKKEILLEIEHTKVEDKQGLESINKEKNDSFTANSKLKNTQPNSPNIVFSNYLIAAYLSISVIDSLKTVEKNPTSTIGLPKIDFLAEQQRSKEQNEPFLPNNSPIIIKSQEIERSMDLTMGLMVTFTDQELSDGLGYSVGAMHYWRISTSIQLGTGGYLSQNSNSYSSNKDFGPQVLLSDFVSASRQSPVTVYEEQKVQTIALEIPLIAQYDYSSQREKGWSLGLGISSLFYLKQSFYNSGNLYYGTQVEGNNGVFNTVLNTEPFENEEKVPALEKSDWAGLATISTLYRISKRWETEVFLKYPLQAITAKDLKLSYTGFNLRYRFYTK